MCGIVGLIDTREPYYPDALIEAMRDSMVQRGPDGVGGFRDGAVALAMRRLAIIDLEHGSQPLYGRGDRIVAFQNGEIYNFRELRAKLERENFVFATQSDTEVLAHGYARWGIDGLLDRIDGMYAIAILDRDSRELHLARDRFGEKPLFYLSAPGRFAYSSDLRPLVALPWAGNDALDLISLDRYLALHYVPGDRTLFENVRRLLPGRRLRVSIDDPEPQIHTYYRLPTTSESPIADEELTRLIEASVKSRLVADVPVGVFLSGGVDSSIVAAIAAQANPRINTFSIGFRSKQHDESAHARAVASHIGSMHHEFVFDESKFMELVPQVASALDEPLGDQAALPLYWLCREARKAVKVVLSGEGADEIFGGYSYYGDAIEVASLRTTMRRWLRGTGRSSQARFLDEAALTTHSGFPLVTDLPTRRRIMPDRPDGLDTWEDDILAQLARCRDPLARASLADMLSWLPDDLLVKLDRMAMAHSLEGRVPYLQPDVTEAALWLAANQRWVPGQSKVALRRVATRWLPRSILERPKQGFVLPMKNWLATWFREVGDVREYFVGRLPAALSAIAVASHTEAETGGSVRDERFVFALLMLAEWHDNFAARRAQLRALFSRVAPRYGAAAYVGGHT
jgi:asparagine synthase (glutamine-hydrolysing)